MISNSTSDRGFTGYVRMHADKKLSYYYLFFSTIQEVVHIFRQDESWIRSPKQ